MKKYNIGIIGYGWAAMAHIDAINATNQGQVVAVYSSRPQNPEELSGRHGGKLAVYNDLEEMLADSSIDIVSICSCPNDHAHQAILAAKAGKHIILEKPVGVNWEECLAVEAAVKDARVKCCVCFECRFSSQFLVTKAILDQGLLGNLHYGEVDYYHGIGPWYGQFRWNIRKKAGGSALLTAGCHALDALLLCMGTDVVEVSSYDTKSGSPDFAPYEYPTTSVTILKFASGRIGKCAAVVDCLQPYYFHTHLIGSEGSLLDNKFHSSNLKVDKSAWSRLSMKLVDSGDVSDHPYHSQFQVFFDALDRDEEMPLTSLMEAMKSFRIIFAADKSAAAGTPVRIDDFARPRR